MLVQQKQNIKGFTLLELLVVLAIIGAVAGVGFPNFNKWSIDRNIRAQSEKVATIFSIATTQVERGEYPYVRVEFKSTSGSEDPEKQIITVKGLNLEKLSGKLNDSRVGPPTCKASDVDSDILAQKILDKKVKLFHLEKSDGAVCFSKGAKYFKQYGKADTQQNVNIPKTESGTNKFVVVCHKKMTSCNPVGGNFSDDYPVYLVKYSRFGFIEKYKWNKNEKDWKSR